MVMDVAGSYGDWRQPRTPSHPLPPSLAPTRQQSPISTADVNFNSPGHRSSQDGSFIQDEDMQLILEFGAKAAAAPPPNRPASTGQNVGILSESWMRRHAKWATDFDTNVAELDFDHFSRRDIRTLRRAAAAYHLGKNVSEEEAEMMWDSFTTAAHDSLARPAPSADCNHNKIKTAPPCNSLDASLAVSAASLFSSAGGPGGNTDSIPPAPVEQPTAAAAAMVNNQPAAATAFISTDSLDMSSMAGREELIRQACATKKRDYILTFDRGGGVVESGVGGSDDTDYQDACLSNAVEQSFLNDRTGASPSDLTDSDGESPMDKIKRSYEMRPVSRSDGWDVRFTSLPNLITAVTSRQDLQCVGGGEKMLSAEGNQCVPIYQLGQQSPVVSLTGSMGEDAMGRLELLKAFKSKMSGTVDRLPLPQFRQEHSSGGSSGYVTGTGSQQGCSAIRTGAKPKLHPKTTAGNRKECEGEMRPTSSALREEQENSELVSRFTPADDYRYAEFFINGRYIDINHNEIGFVPPSTGGVQVASSSQQQFFVNDRQDERDFATPPPQLTSFHQQAARAKSGNAHGPVKPPRTFATLLDQARSGSDVSNVEYVIQQRPERAPYGRRILPKIPDESNVNGTEVSRMKDSATQVPVYVVDQSVQTTPASAPSVGKGHVGEPSHVGIDWRKGPLAGPSSALFGDVPDLNFLKFPFNVPQLFPHVPPFPLAFLTDGPDITSFVAQQAKLVNAGEDQLAAPRCILPCPPSSVMLSKAAAVIGGTKPLLDQTRMRDSAAGPATRAQSPLDGTRRDSGLGSSGGPSHIQDWDSLATLLPKDVLQAYSYFKANSDLLGKSTPVLRPDLNIDKLFCQCTSSSNGKCGKRVRPKVGSSLQKIRRLGKKHRPLSEPAFKRKQFASIVEEEGACDGECGNCCIGRAYHRHHCHTATWCCAAPSPTCHGHCSGCHSVTMCRRCERTLCKRRSIGHVCVGDTDDTEEEGKENSDEQQYRPMNDKARKMGGEWSDDERLMAIPLRTKQGQSFIFSDDDDEEDEEEDDDEQFHIPLAPWRAAHSEYHVRDSKTASFGVPKFYSVQNVKEIGQFGQVGFPLKRLRHATLTGDGTKPCATCYRVRSPSRALTESGSVVVVVEEEQCGVDCAEEVFCDCNTSDVMEELLAKQGQPSGTNGTRDQTCWDDQDVKRCQRRDARGEYNASAICHQKRVLIHCVVDACNKLMKYFTGCRRPESWQDISAENAKAASAIIRYSLCPTLERLVADGLTTGKTVWSVVLASTTLGPATKSIYELVTDLNKLFGDNGEHSLLFAAFVIGLMSLRSLDCWLSYLSLKDKVLVENYVETSFFRKASTAYRALFDELSRAIQPLAVLPLDQLRLDPRAVFSGQADVNAWNASMDPSAALTPHHDQRHRTNVLQYSLIPSRLPSDSRVPKSSSVPSRLVRYASEPPKSRSLDTGLRMGVVADTGSFGLLEDLRLTATRAGMMESDVRRSSSSSRPSRIPVLLKSSRSCPGGPRQRSLSNRRGPAACLQSVDSESAMSVTTSTFSEIDAPDCHLGSDSDYRPTDARYVYAIDDEKGDARKGVLPFSKGDTMILLEDKDDGGLLRCQRANQVGLVPRKKVTYVTFL